MLKNKTTKSIDLKRPRIGIDLLGSNLSERLLLQTLLETTFPGPHPPLFTLFGTLETFHGFGPTENFTFHEVTEVIQPEDSPLAAIRTKKNSSLVVGVQALKDYAIDAFITAGNSGSLLATATLNLPLLPSIDRPGFITLMPTKEDPTAVIDVGANVNVEPNHLLQFAKMGIAYQKSRGIEKPVVGLLNIGEEEKKEQLSTKKPMNFYAISIRMLPSIPLHLSAISKDGMFFAAPLTSSSLMDLLAISSSKQLKGLRALSSTKWKILALCLRSPRSNP